MFNNFGWVFEYWWVWLLTPPLFIFARLALLYIRAPIYLYRGYKLVDPSPIRYLDGDDELPQVVRVYFHDACEVLAQLGFERYAICQFSDTGHLRSFATYLVRHGSSDGVVVALTHVINDDGNVTATDEFIAFGTRFRDGTTVHTNNSHVIGALRERPSSRVVQFIDCYDPRELYRRHWEICKRLNQGPRIWRLDDEFRGNVSECLQTLACREPNDYQVECGLLRRVNNAYRPTIYGACVLAWQEMFPWRHFRIISRQNEAKRWLKVIRAGSG
ncbi:MAG: hypothetical protein AB7O26_07915 [Planctomycetaceae bacterium]